MREYPICPDGLRYIFPVACLLILALAYSPWILLTAILGIVLLFLLWFFRNPNRAFTPDEMVFLSPCDAQVMSIDPYEDPLLGSSIRIIMFLSIFNVHVNRTPCTARVIHQEYRPGKMLPAYKPHASEENERNRVVFETPDGFRYAVHQITGILARRIVSNVTVGSFCKQGERFGMIRFGSCTELILPEGTQICVQPGDRVRGVRSVLARRKEAL